MTGVQTCALPISERILDAIDRLGLRTDGRLLALNSYENRVFQIGLEDAAPVIAKFYRPGRWTDAQILEEHAFATELAGREIPVVAPEPLDGKTLHAFKGFRFAVYPRRGGRTPELEDEKVLEWIGRFLGRIHAVGAAGRFRSRPALNLKTFGTEARDWLLESAAHREAEAFDRAIDLRITRLRRKIEVDPAHPDSIRTVRGVGYMFVPPKD